MKALSRVPLYIRILLALAAGVVTGLIVPAVAAEYLDIPARMILRLLGAIAPEGPEINRERIEKFKKQLEENLALASFGL